MAPRTVLNWRLYVAGLGADDDRDGGGDWILPQAPRGFEPVEVLHPQIHEDHLRPVRLRQRNRLEAARGGHHPGRAPQVLPAGTVRRLDDVPGGDHLRAGLARDPGALGEHGAQLAQVQVPELDRQAVLVGRLGSPGAGARDVVQADGAGPAARVEQRVRPGAAADVHDERCPLLLAGDVVRLLAQALVVILLALLLGARLSPAWGAVLPAALSLALFATAFSSLSCALALKTRTQETMAAFVHLVNLPILFTSTALVPVRHMPGWLAAAASFNPLTLTVDAWRGALLFGEMPSLGQLLPLAILGIACHRLVLLGRQAGAIPRPLLGRRTLVYLGYILLLTIVATVPGLAFGIVMLGDAIVSFEDGSQASIIYASDGHSSTPKERLEVLGRGHTVLIEKMAQDSGAEVIQKVGKTALLLRRNARPNPRTSNLVRGLSG